MAKQKVLELQSLRPLQHDKAENVLIDPQEWQVEDVPAFRRSPIYKSILETGITAPVLLATIRDRKGFVIMDGRRRIFFAQRAIEECRENGVSAKHLMQLPARIYKDLTMEEVRVWSAVLNEHREENILTVIEMCRSFMNGHEHPHTLNQLTDLTNIPKARIQKYLRISRLPDTFVDGLQAGTLSLGTLEEISKLDPVRQQAAETLVMQQVDAGKRVTAGMVRELRTVQTTESQQLIAMQLHPPDTYLDDEEEEPLLILCIQANGKLRLYSSADHSDPIAEAKAIKGGEVYQLFKVS